MDGSVAAADLQSCRRPVGRDFQSELDRPATDGAVLDITRRSGAEVDQGFEGLSAVGALDGPHLQARRAVLPGVAVARLDYRLEAVELVQIRWVLLASRHAIHPFPLRAPSSLELRHGTHCRIARPFRHAPCCVPQANLFGHWNPAAAARREGRVRML